MIRVFIGYDGLVRSPFNVLQHSIHEHASMPVMVSPLRLSQLESVFHRERNPLQSTEFSFTRFLAPYLCNFEGWCIFTDNDMLFRDDIAKLWALRDERYAVQVVKHNHVPKNDVKFLDAAQTRYEKKNWSSVMMFNNAKCKALTPDYVNTASGLELHQFKWLENDDQIGALPKRWNLLVGVDEYDPEAGNVHFTDGGPYFDEFQHVDYADEWRAIRDSMNSCQQREKPRLKIVK